MPSRTVAVLGDDNGLVVVAERHSGSAGPPRRSEALVLREELQRWVEHTGQVDS